MRINKYCSFCKQPNPVADTRYFYDNKAGIYLYVCYECLTKLVLKHWKENELRSVR